jgi:ATP-dependent protease ClpP protease subunit
METITDHKNKRIFITGPVDDKFIEVYKFVYELLNDYDNKEEWLKTPIELHIDSYGGDAFVPLSLHNLVKSIPERPKIYTYNMNKCESSALTLFLLGDKRFAYTNSTFMIHDISMYMSYKINRPSLNSALYMTEQQAELLYKMYKEKTKLTKKDISKITDYNLDRYMNASEAFELGICNSLI